MQIILENAGKRFNRDWIFRSLNYTFSSGQAYAITGNNGSGKSTLLLSLSGATALNEGRNLWHLKKEATLPLPEEQLHRYLTVVAPYLELIEEMTAMEFLKFHSAFKPLLPGISIEQVLEEVQLKTAANKQIRYYSSGMKQRIKLAQAFFTDVPVLLLDEPCTNLDTAGFDLYKTLISRYTADRLVIVSSNDPQEYGFCHHRIDIRDYKTGKKSKPVIASPGI